MPKSRAKSKASSPQDPSLAQSVQPFIDKAFISGAVLLATTKDKVLSLEAVGYADLKAKKPMTKDSLFWIASMTKPITCTALMMLVDEGKVKVNDPVEKYLPEFKGQMFIETKDDDHVVLKKPKRRMLVRDVMSHTSGLPFATPNETPTYDRLPLEHAVRGYAMVPLLSEPGTKYSYSNAGIAVAARIIEVVSGLPFADFMDKRLFRPLGMKETTFWPSREQLKRFAKIYHARKNGKGLEEGPLTQLAYPFDNPERTPLAGGGLFSTAGDVVKFCQMILNGGTWKDRRYLSPKAIKQMTTKQTGDHIENAYGFGWDAGDGKFGHGGAYKTNMTINAKLGLITVYLIHHNGDWPSDEGKTIHATFVKAAENLLGP